MSTKGKVLLLSILAFLVIVIIVVIACISSPKEGVGSIDYKDYEKLIKKENTFVYYGEGINQKEIKEFSETYGVDISILNPKDLSASEVKSLGLKNDYLYVYNKGKEVYNVDFNSKKYEIVKQLMSKNLIEKNYIEVSLSEYKELVKNDGYNVMFIGRETCSWCNQFKQSIKEGLKENEFYIYYIDTDKLGESDFKELYATDSYLTEEEWGTPLTFIYKDGKRIDVINGYVDSKGLVEALKKNKVL